MTRRLERLAWMALGAAALTTVSPWVGSGRGRLVTSIQSLMPWAALSAAPIALRAAGTGHRRLATASAVVGAAGALMARPLVVRRPQPAVDPESRPLSVVHANLLYVNHRVADVPARLATLDADVLTFSELTPSHAARLGASALAAEYPHRIELPARHASGTGLWSRYPVTECATARTKHHTVVADVAAPGGTIQVIVIHAQSPIDHHEQWVSDLDRLGDLPVDQPAVMTGDFNAGWWHPEFRRLLRRGGWRDAHMAVGRGLSCSWPTDQWHVVFRWHPPFVRLDHALVNDGLAVLDTVDFDVPGSDHRGLLVTVQRVAPAAP